MGKNIYCCLSAGKVCWNTAENNFFCRIHPYVASSIPDGVIGIFNWLNPSGRTIALGLTEPLTEMSTMSYHPGRGGWGGVKRPVCRAAYLATFMYRLSRNSGNLNLLEPYGSVQACRWVGFLLSSLVVTVSNSFVQKLQAKNSVYLLVQIPKSVQCYLIEQGMK
jgi:hypothetical protein